MLDRGKWNFTLLARAPFLYLLTQKANPGLTIFCRLLKLIDEANDYSRGTFLVRMMSSLSPLT